jgi:autotransporter-associated beta strand protein
VPPAHRAVALGNHPLLAKAGAAAYPAHMRELSDQRRRGSGLVAVMAAALAGGGVAPAQTAYPIVSWYDEFDGPAIDPERWVFDLGTGSEFGLVGWGNNELQYYTDRTANARLSNGHLEITARREALGGMDYTSARLTTRGRFSQAGGRFEIRAALPLGQGLWPAFWMLPADSVYGGWAASGEIDILEARGQHPNQIENTIHYGGSWPNNEAAGRSFTLPAGGSIADFHTYALEWTVAPTPSLRWYVDDRLSWSTTNWWSTGGSYPAPFDRPFHLLVNLAVGGNFVGPPDNSTPFPGTMRVDYVRVYDAAPPNLVIDVASGSRTQFEAGYGRILQADSLTKVGAGTLVVDAANQFAGVTTVQAGRLHVANSVALASSPIRVTAGGILSASEGAPLAAPAVTLAGGRLEVPALVISGTGIGRLTVEDGVIAGTPAVRVADGGQFALPPGAPTTVIVGGLEIDEQVGGGLVDLGRGRIRVAAGGTTAVAILGDILAGRNDGSWNGTSGITSASVRAAAGTRAIGYRIEDDATATIAYAAPGDTNLDGVVDLLDLLEILGSGTYETSVASGWSQGDFNYDGVTDLIDLLGILGSGTYDQGNYLEDPSVAATSLAPVAVPEPSWGGAAAVIFLVFFARRR